MMRPVTKLSVKIISSESTGEAAVNAFRAATTPRQGASFISFPVDVQKETTEAIVPAQSRLPALGAAPAVLIEKVANKLRQAKKPVVLLGSGASEAAATHGIRTLLKRFAMPVVGTFQGAGAISRELLPLFFGRIGLFRNQPGDKLLASADVILTIGYDPVEYGPDAWNAARAASIIYLDDYPCDIDNYYQPEIELCGNVEDTLLELVKLLESRSLSLDSDLRSLRSEWDILHNPPLVADKTLIHPLNFIRELRELVDDETVIASDSVRITFGWVATSSTSSRVSFCSAMDSRRWA